MKTKVLLALSASVLFFSACSLAPEYKKPQMQLPAAQKEINVNEEWFKTFNDQKLNLLIAEALKNNDDLKLAVANVQKARAQYDISDADLYPQLDLSGSALRQKRSVNAYPGFFGGLYNDFSMSASMSYEFDFWGKNSNQRDANLANFLAVDANKESLRISLITDVATYYFNLVAVEEQLKIAQESLKNYEESLAYREKQYKYGVIDSLTLAQSKAEAASVRTTIDALNVTKVKIQSSLVILLGRSPKEIFEGFIDTKTELPEFVKIPTTLPTNLLQNRPDVKIAEENLKAKTALIGVAKAAYFPNLSITGSYGFQSQKVSNLANSNSQVWGIGPSLYMPLFDFGRISASVKVTDAEQKAALIEYGKTVKNAYKEVFDSLQSIKAMQSKKESMEQEVAAYDEAYRVAKKKYAIGTTSYLDVLIAQNLLLNSQLAYVTTRSELLIEEATLYKALGGGWRSVKD
ncbi:efflux transporter outer membrane subunit [Sulfurimonas marina]|uniref:Efflux transporter outer membrane subunit n=1 Tax=Sulfurimonas marina TaxID=2590551 RepID=A0A7M1AUM8_9BACT|nr:efflux transporter outer membrane subunit [Sulfurimonas marina]QOP41133.1 efflux transporter outer membrane subunit [Sulfurimonas marina]